MSERTPGPWPALVEALERLAESADDAVRHPDAFSSALVLGTKMRDELRGAINHARHALAMARSDVGDQGQGAAPQPVRPPRKTRNKMPVGQDETEILPAPLTHRQREVRKAARFALMGLLANVKWQGTAKEYAMLAADYAEALVVELEQREATGGTP